MTTLREAAQQALEACEQRLPLKGQAAIIDELNNLRAALVEDAMQKFTDVNQELEAALAEDVVTHGSAWSKDGKRIDPMSVYAEPVQEPQRKPLTEEEIRRIDDGTHFHESPDWSLRFARAIERAHGIGDDT